MTIEGMRVSRRESGKEDMGLGGHAHTGHAEVPVVLKKDFRPGRAISAAGPQRGIVMVEQDQVAICLHRHPVMACDGQA